MIGGCKMHQNEKRYNYRHNSVLLNILRELVTWGYNCIQRPTRIQESKRWLPSRHSICQGEYIVHYWVVGRVRGIQRKTLSTYNEYVNLSMGVLGTFGKSCSNFKSSLEKNNVPFLLSKMVNVCIRTLYYNFFMRNKPWEFTELMTWWPIVFNTNYQCHAFNAIVVFVSVLYEIKLN